MAEILRFDYTPVLKRKIENIIRDISRLNHPQARRATTELKLLVQTLGTNEETTAQLENKRFQGINSRSPD